MPDGTVNVITICGSLRRGSINASIARALPALAPAAMSIKPAPPFTDIPFYNADIQHEQGFPAPVNTLADAIRAADGVIIVSPEYNWTIPGALKNALDWISRMKEQPFRDKPVALQSASGGPLGGSRMQYHLRQSLAYLDVLLLGKPEIFVTFAAQKIDEKTGEIKDQPTIDIIKQQLASFDKFIRKMSDRR